MKNSDQLATVLRQASREVNSWQHWQRSIDPQGASRISNKQGKTPSKTPNTSKQK
jgi:hypothetical protein